MEFKTRTLYQLATLICGDIKENKISHFVYRSSFYLTEFFGDAETDFVHDGSTRPKWVSETLTEILKEPSTTNDMPSDTFCRVIQVLMDKADAHNEDKNRLNALEELNTVLSRDNFEAFYADDNICYLKHIPSQKVLKPSANPHRPFTNSEIKRREALVNYLGQCSEDELIEEILLPLFRQLGYYRISIAGHKDKSLEYGKDIWMKFMLPTQHWLYFGVQVKKGKLDASGMTKGSNANVAEIHNQALMMLAHEIFDPEIGKNVLVDHAFIVAGGEITKAAKNWLANVLDKSKRSQILFMERDDIINQFIVNNLPLPNSALPIEISIDDDLPF
ncbi:hypothetical protein AQ505_08150 [Pedobacter sp. PACM 27299]|uniref:hypothetical protein n=1 Tax=Pedobacter sp. PACM 27299 TaxID=1727164 RepID=UPI000706456F|nr:hypothetical protein [Pedobacter sp. PACM 27299]ALL05466.1 hypothetical protein AQ505_08150 [Pedobacter sp. PACM 27299]